MPLMAAAVMAMIFPGLSMGSRQALPQAAIPLNLASVRVDKTKDVPSSTKENAAPAVTADLVPAPSSLLTQASAVRTESAPPQGNPVTPAGGLSGALVSPSGFLPAMRPNYPPPSEQQQHRFWDRANTIGFTVHGVTRIVDTAQSCVLLSRPGRREAWLPTKSCAGIAAYSLSTIPAQIGTSYLMHKSGHHQLERWVPYFWAAPSAAGIAVSFKAW